MQNSSENLPISEPKIVCCNCGTLISPNPSNMCVGCLRSKIDITENIPKQVTIQFCRGCERYHQPPSEWIHCTLESKELLTFCLKRLKSLNTVKLVDANFVWTEPHSKRIKIKLTVQGEVIGGAILQQIFIVDYIISHHMCGDCHRSEAQDFWKALVQIRQKSDNKKMFYYLEQLMVKYKTNEYTLGIKPIDGGLDFYFANEANARKMVDFFSSVLPCKYQHSKKLISHDIHSNIYNYKFTYSVEIVPISKDSLVCLSKKLSLQLGGISQICLVHRITSSIHLIDPLSAQIADLNSTVYWRYPFNNIFMSKQLVEYTVIDIELVREKDRITFAGQGAMSHKHVLADVWVVKTSELGISQNTIHTKTHLGHILKHGDSVLGYNIADSNVNDVNFNNIDKDNIADVVLVKKHYPKCGRRNKRFWKLKHITQENITFDRDEREYNEFLDELEEDPDIRKNIMIFKDSTKIIPVDINEVYDENEPHITLDEMFDDLTLEDVQMAE